MIITRVSNKVDKAGRDISKFAVNGVGEYSRPELVLQTVAFVIPLLMKTCTLEEAVKQFNSKIKCSKDDMITLTDPKLAKYEAVKMPGDKNVYALKYISQEEAEDFEKTVNEIYGKLASTTTKPLDTTTKEDKPTKSKVEKTPKTETTTTNGVSINIDTLIAAALADGKVTDKERAVLIKKVKEAGGDVDEFEMLLDAKIYEAQQKAKKTIKEDKPKAEKKPKSNDPFEDLMVKVEGGVFKQEKYRSESYTYQPEDKRKKSETRYRQVGYSRQVKLSDFQICKYQVTQKQWKTVMGEFPQPQKWEGDDLPVHNVSWEDAQKFIEKLNQMTGKKYHLPTEAQWEFAARGGNKTHNYKYAGSDNIDEVAHYTENSWQRVQPVGQKKANELGLYDMSGNVWEWCFDWYTENLGSTNLQDPTGPSSGSYRVNRGGSWDYGAGYCECSCRYYFTPSIRLSGIGFRLAL